MVRETQLATSIAASTPTPTEDLAYWVTGQKSHDITAKATTWAKHAMLDWFGVTLGGSTDPLVQILVDDALEEGEGGCNRLIGRAERVIPARAALINGAASHALDFDDVNRKMSGHPTVTVAPAVLALAEQRNFNGRETIDTFVIGYETACHVGEMMGRSHYEKGWHATATVGTFGATAAAARLLGLDAEQTTMALGIAATQASGLKSMFGTMCKPLHAGRAAMNGLLAARWAARGFTSNRQALECAQGFAATQSTTFETIPLQGESGRAFAVESNLFKYHAACYFTHASIDAMNDLRDDFGFVPDDVLKVHAHVPRQHLDVCDIREPRTGLEMKFSIRQMIAMALAGLDTGDTDLYNPETAVREDLVKLRQKVELHPEDYESRHVSEMVIELYNGRVFKKWMDVGIAAEDTGAQWTRLTDKFLRLAEPVVGLARARQAIALINNLDQAENLHPLLELLCQSEK